jgi:hypothetical protein
MWAICIRLLVYDVHLGCSCLGWHQIRVTRQEAVLCSAASFDRAAANAFQLPCRWVPRLRRQAGRLPLRQPPVLEPSRSVIREEQPPTDGQCCLFASVDGRTTLRLRSGSGTPLPPLLPRWSCFSAPCSPSLLDLDFHAKIIFFFLRLTSSFMFVYCVVGVQGWEGEKTRGFTTEGLSSSAPEGSCSWSPSPRAESDAGYSFTSVAQNFVFQQNESTFGCWTKHSDND